MKEQRSKRVVALLVTLVWVGAVAPALMHLRGLQGPYDWDGFRDVAAAQALIDGKVGSDPFYRGEVAWYPPLMPAFVALTATVSGDPVPAAFVLTGLWLNAFIPIAFFLVARRVTNDWVAVVALAAFLFLPGRAPAWASSTYSPWLFPSVSAQVPFYLSLWAWCGTLDRPTMVRGLASGVLLGITFLSHSAAAAVLGGTMLVTLVSHVFLGSLAARRCATILAVAFLSAASLVAPFLAPLAIQYGLQTVNRAPATWVYEGAHPLALLESFAKPAALLYVLLFVVGARWCVRTRPRSQTVLLAAWFLVASAGWAYAVGAERWDTLPSVVPAFHFLFLMRSAAWIVWACGAVALWTLAVQTLWSRWRGASAAPVLVHASLVLCLCIAVYPRYLGRDAFAKAAQFSREALEPDEIRAYEWIRQHTSPSAVFLASELDALKIVGPAGRFVVSVERHFSSPYVDHGARAAAQQAMFAAATADPQEFERLRRRFGVSHVLVRVPEQQPSPAGGVSGTMYPLGSLQVIAITTAPPRNAEQP